MIPNNLPVFPLPNVVLFPHTFLPLHIFEPRYRTMLSDTLGSDGLFVITQMKEVDSNPSLESAFYNVGCIAKIIRADALEDGRWNILVQGTALVDIKDEIIGKPYRQNIISLRTFQDEKGLSEQDRLKFRNMFYQYVIDDDKRSSKLDMAEFFDTPISDEILLNTIAMALKVDPVERQFLLESQSIQELCSRISQLWEFLLVGRNITNS